MRRRRFFEAKRLQRLFWAGIRPSFVCSESNITATMGGFTQGEEFLSQLGRRTFLSFWSWPNLFRDQGDCVRGGDGKEICDLSVIFDENIILFSDKGIRFQKERELGVAWPRWARKAIKDSHKQLMGSERWIQQYPDRIFLDPQCSTKIPIPLPKPDRIAIHKVIIAHGIEEILLEQGLEPSFRFDLGLTDEISWMAGNETPFTLGKLSGESFVHIFTQAAIELALREFDTTKDFIWYLAQRKRLLTSSLKIKISSESDILQLYYEGIEDYQAGRIIDLDQLSASPSSVVSKGGISNLHWNPSYQAKKYSDGISYFWDDLVEGFNHHVLNQTSERKINWTTADQIEPILRNLAKPSRFERRVLSEIFTDFYHKTPPRCRATRVFTNPEHPETSYLFLLLPHLSFFESESNYRDIRVEMLASYCSIAKLRLPHTKGIIAIGAKTRDEADTKITPEFLEEGQDFMWHDVSEWNAEDEDQAKRLETAFKQEGFIGERQWFEGRSFEFPDESGSLRNLRKKQIKGSSRNEPCWCGSGKKIKKCCGK